jgi:hypothetical protein
MKQHNLLLGLRRTNSRGIGFASTPVLAFFLTTGLGGCESSRLNVTPPAPQDGGGGGGARPDSGGVNGGSTGTGGVPGSGGIGNRGGTAGSTVTSSDGGNNRDAGPGSGGTGYGGGIGGTSTGRNSGGAPGSGGLSSIGGTSSGGIYGSGGTRGTGGLAAGGATGGIGSGGGGAAGGWASAGASGSGGASATGGTGSGDIHGSGGIGGTGGLATGGTSGGVGSGGLGPIDGSATGGASGGVGSGGTGSGGSGSGGSSGGALQGIISAFCTAARTCCAQAGLPISVLSDCEAKFPTHRPLVSLLDLGQATTNPAAVAACEAAYKQAASTCTTKEVLAACTGIFVGLETEGQPCGKGGTPDVPGALACKQTGGPEVCLWTAPNTSDPSVAGMCKKMVHGRLGDVCVSTCVAGDDCSVDELTSPTDTSVTWCFEADGLYCSYQTNTPSCASVVAVGKDCSADSEACGSATYCDINSVCTAKSVLGESCSSTPCVRPYVCGTSNKCETASTPFADPDIACQGFAPELL